jgi:serine/threonine protein kinase
MTVDQEWLRNGAFASLDGVEVTPLRHPYLRDIPLSISRGQAMAYFLTDRQQRSWILKKFLPGRDPDGTYIRAIRDLIPRQNGFESGTQRRVLSASSIGTGFRPPAFVDWIENTILMPRVSGSDWQNLADSLRAGKWTLTDEQRVAICRNLLASVEALETHELSHRDLSVTNVFIDPVTWNVQFIDWDGVYHPSLAMPLNTTTGTSGYTAPIVRINRAGEAAATWCPRSDRFAMAILICEFLVMGQGTPLANDGGMFEQDELYAGSGPRLHAAEQILHRRWPGVCRLLRRALEASTFAACPSPAEWRESPSLASPVNAPRLTDVANFMADFEANIRRLQQEGSPPPAPRIADLPAIDLNVFRRAAALFRAVPPAPQLDDASDVAKPEHPK